MQRTEGLILKGIGGFYYVKTADAVLECRARGIFRREGRTPLCGDRVLVAGDAEGYVVDDILPRKNAFARPPVANVDTLFFVVSMVQPRPNFQVLDTLTAIAHHSGVQPVIVLTKTDLVADDGVADIYRAAGYEVMDLRANFAASLARIRALSEDRISVFAGNSGAGKSTLLNDLCPELELATAEPSEKLGRGKHTTRAVTLYEFCGGYVADTPGFSALDFERGFAIKKEQLADCFPDIAKHAKDCYFAGCSHRVEKGCAVLEALKRGDIHPIRHANYCALYEQAAQQKDWE